MEKERKEGNIPVKGNARPAARRLNYKDAAEALRSKVGNDITQNIVESLEGDGIEAEVKAVDRGYMILAKGGFAYLENAYDEDEDDLAVHGSAISMDSLRLPWLRNALRKVFGYESEDALFDSLLNSDLQYPTWRMKVCLRILPQSIFDEETGEKLMNVQWDINAGPIYYPDFFRTYFSRVLPEGFSLPNPDYPRLFPDTVKALWSIINEDKDYKQAVKAANDAARKLIDEAAKDPEGLKKRVSEEGRKAYLERLKREEER